MDNNQKNRSLKISIILPTYNGEKNLPSAIQSLLNQTLEKKEYEIIVVNNCSTDGTEKLVEKYVEAHPGVVRLISEPIQGVNRARNAGVRASSAPLVAFIDDDARAEPAWLETLVEAFENPQVGGAVGPIAVEWTCKLPEWWNKNLDNTNGYFNLGKKPIFLGSLTLYESNMAFRKSVLARVGLFRESMGYSGSQMMAHTGEEMSFRVNRAGFKILYHPEARIRHLGVERRTTRQYIFKQSYFKGKSRVDLHLLTGRTKVKIISRLPFMLARALIKFIVFNPFNTSGQCFLVDYVGYTSGLVAALFKPIHHEPPPPLEKPGEPLKSK